MIVMVPCWSGDEALAARVAHLARACDGDHDIRIIKREDDGRIPALRTTVTANAWPAAPTAVMKSIVASLPDGAVFLNLEPDAVLTRGCALDQLETAFHRLRSKWPRSCVMGHWKSPPNTPHAPVEHISGSAVYCVTPRFRQAMAKANPMRPWDLDLFFRNLLQPDEGCDTPLIRCLWGRAAEFRSARMMLDRYPHAVLIHGDKSGGLLTEIEVDISSAV